MTPDEASLPRTEPTAEPAAGAAADRDSGGDGGIPMLTDVLHLPRYQPSELPADLAQIDWSALELRVQENVTERLVRRSQALLDQQLRDSLVVIVERASRSLTADLQDTLAQMIRETVAQAVREELTRVHTEITRLAPDT